MPKILTPVSLWNNFDASLETNETVNSVIESDGVKIERVNFFGRETEKGRVKIAAAFAYDEASPSPETVLIIPDSTETINEQLLKLFVKHGYSALMADYRGEWNGCSFNTVYPDDIDYANTAKCGRRKDFVDDSADKTCWYEWVGVGIYARKYIEKRTGVNKIAVVGIRDGGEIAWKLGVSDGYSCIIPVCAAGWKAYAGISKYLREEPKLDDERYRFIAGIDSQAYAPYVKCPVLMLCSTNDKRFDYDRAYDTFSRINPEFVGESAISYSIRSHSCIGKDGTTDMFMFLDKFLKSRQVFIPKPVELSVEVDEEENLIASANFDDQGMVESCKCFLAEDSFNPATRDWILCMHKGASSDNKQEFYLNVYEKTATIFVFGKVKYSNGFTVWSKMAVKKLRGKFRNMQGKSRVMYSSSAIDCFCVATTEKFAVGGIFFPEGEFLPKIVTKAKNIGGLYSACGLATFRMATPRYAPSEGNLLSLDVFCDNTATVTIKLTDLTDGDEYFYNAKIIGGVWQSVIAESKQFKTPDGSELSAYSGNLMFTITCNGEYGVNNVMWL